MNARKLAIVSVALAGVLAAASVEARDRDDVQLSVTIGGPAWATAGAGLSRPRFRGAAPTASLRPRERSLPQPTRWDRDGDGIPNRYDRVYNPRWDRDGDGIPNRYDRHDKHPSRSRPPPAGSGGGAHSIGRPRRREAAGCGRTASTGRRGRGCR